MTCTDCLLKLQNFGPTEAQTQRTNSCRKIVPAPVHLPTPTEAQYYSSFTMPPLSLSLSLSHTNIHSRTQALSISLFLSLSVSLCVSLSLYLFLSPSPSPSLSLSFSFSLEHTHTHIACTPFLQVYRSTLAQYPRNHTNTTGQHLATSLLLYNYLLQITMSPPRHISYSLLLPTTGLQVNTSSKPPEPSESYQYLLQVCRSTRRQNPQKHTSTTGHHVTTAPYILFPTTTYYRSAGQHE